MHLLVATYGRTFWSQLLVATYGRTFWSQLMVATYGRTFWYYFLELIVLNQGTFSYHHLGRTIAMVWAEPHDGIGKSTLWFIQIQ
jgi:hypothetical protein